MNIKDIKLYINSTFSILKSDDLIKKLFILKDKILKIKNQKKKVIIIGNGGSSSTANHFSVDLTKNAKIRCINFNDTNLITCFGNDYGFKRIYEKSLEYYFEKNDLVIILSVSGNSENLVNAARYCIKNNINLVTFTGSKKNKLISLNKNNLNFFINSKSYNQVEIIHHFLLLTLVDIIIGKFEYKSNL